MEKFFTSPGGSFIRVYWSGTGYKYDEIADYGSGEILFWSGREFLSDYGLKETTEAAYYVAFDLLIETLTAKIPAK